MGSYFPLFRVFFPDLFGNFLAQRLFPADIRSSREGWLSPVEGTRLEIERGSDVTVGSNPTPSALL